MIMNFKQICNLQNIQPLPTRDDASWPTSDCFSHQLQCTRRKHMHAAHVLYSCTAVQQLQLMSSWLLLHAAERVHSLDPHGPMSIPMSCHGLFY